MIAHRVFDYEPVIKALYATDERFWSYFDCEPSLKNCVADTVNKFKVIPDLKFYVVEDESIVGYFAHETLFGVPWLTGMFIAPQYRDRKEEFIDTVIKRIGEFWTAIPERNERAIKFYRKRGEFLFKSGENLIFLFERKKRESEKTAKESIHESREKGETDRDAKNPKTSYTENERDRPSESVL